MPLFLRKKQSPTLTYDQERLEPILRSSICTGETTAGFLEKGTGHYTEVCLIRSPGDLAAFRQKYGIEGEIRKTY
ncbi:MAG: aspartate dehydrogenase [Clostridia bacterium]|nr:aspartate dehydrogenase [Clostridia bacterium]